MLAKVSPIKKTQPLYPLVPMRGVVLFPDSLNHFDVGRKRSIAAVEYAMQNGVPIFLVAQRKTEVEDPEKKDLYLYGVVAEVKQLLHFSESLVKVLIECKYRAKLGTLNREGEFLTCTVRRAKVHNIPDEKKSVAEAMLRSLRDQIEICYHYNPKLSKDVILAMLSDQDYTHVVEFLASNLPLAFEDKQAVLEEDDALRRMELLLEILIRENEMLRLEAEIADKVHEQMDSNQREYFLREQMRAISDELGEGPDLSTEAEVYRKKIRLLPLEEDQIKKLLKEADRLVMMQGNQQEATVIRSYLDTVVDLPWNIESKDNSDLKKARAVLNRDHYGLDKVKERIIEFLAVHTLTNQFGAQIICLVGPPGVGKTSIARSVAEAMGRKFVRMSLGGVNSEAEIRGHRRTYVGSMPGRIIDAISQAGTSNPVILLDEIDKLGRDYRGDPASALLEVLDPEQNKTFRDHFLDVPYDLSRVLFLTTANDPSGIPGPLYDRMDIIELSSYTRQEKFCIAKKYLLPKQLKLNGVSPAQFSITDRAIYNLIDDYTREAGVRTLERMISKLIRKAAVDIVTGERSNIRLTAQQLEAFLGPKITRGSLVINKPRIGVANGLAWTSVGGELLPIEVVAIKGSGKIDLTGSLGDIMKESARIAVTLARTLPSSYKVPVTLNTEYDLHIHAPEGAVPKDGPSAGVTLVTAIVSSLSGVPVRNDISMTGEVTLTGRVLPIGGLKEKLIASYKEKIWNVIIPKDNLGDLSEVGKEVLNSLTIHPVETVADVLKLTLLKRSEPLERHAAVKSAKRADA